MQARAMIAEMTAETTQTEATRDTHMRMQAVVAPRYGSPDVLTLTEVPRPQPAPDEVLIEVVAVSVHAGTWHLLRADPFLVRLMFGLTKPKHPILGGDVAGRVVEVGRDVTTLRVGDEVIGDLSMHRLGAFAQMVAAPAELFVKKPEGIALEDAATVPVSAVTALQALRDHAKVRAGQKVLITGASGGVGTFAVQIVKAMGAEVTAVGSTRSLDMLRELGADHVVDYGAEDITQSESKFDAVIDIAAYRSIFDYRAILKPGGIYLQVGGATKRFWQVVFLGPFASMLGDQKLTNMMAKPNAEDLGVVAAMIAKGEVKPAIGRRFEGLAAIPDAIRHVEEGHAKGKTLVRI